MLPPQLIEFGDVCQFAHGAIRFGSVEKKIAFEPNFFFDQMCQIADRDLMAGADIYVCVLRISWIEDGLCGSFEGAKERRGE